MKVEFEGETEYIDTSIMESDSGYSCTATDIIIIESTTSFDSQMILSFTLRWPKESRQQDHQDYDQEERKFSEGEEKWKRVSELHPKQDFTLKFLSQLKGINKVQDLEKERW